MNNIWITSYIHLEDRGEPSPAGYKMFHNIIFRLSFRIPNYFLWTWCNGLFQLPLKPCNGCWVLNEPSLPRRDNMGHHGHSLYLRAVFVIDHSIHVDPIADVSGELHREPTRA